IGDLEDDELIVSEVLNEVIPECFYLESRNEGACRSSIGDLEDDELTVSDVLNEVIPACC
ncbi:hypothetical protein, partial [Vibrio breoganii]|uniref:hypothetical protein n=1 Tax=Vibrio breoganii TaxID=553239 RepID=UPI001A7E0BBF